MRLYVTGEKDAVFLPALEDMIADRVGQYAAGSRSDRTRLRQATTLFQLAETLDMNYLLKRLSEERDDSALLCLPTTGRLEA